jgi:hypothetical protein
VRLVHIAGEFFLFGWTADAARPPGRIKQYRLSRMAEIARAAGDPPGCPSTGLRQTVSLILRDAFRATGSDAMHDRRQVVLAASPLAQAFLENRRWGDRQCWSDDPALPPGWRRLQYVTTGLVECRHSILGMGAEVRAEAPPELIAWLRDQARAVVERAERTMHEQMHSMPGASRPQGQ